MIVSTEKSTVVDSKPSLAVAVAARVVDNVVKPAAVWFGAPPEEIADGREAVLARRMGSWYQDDRARNRWWIAWRFHYGGA